MTDLQKHPNNTFGAGNSNVHSINFLYSQLFSLMRSGSEIYLSNNSISDKKCPETKIKSKNLLKKTRNSLLKLLPKAKNDGIEELIAGLKENINEKKGLADIEEQIAISNLKEVNYSKPAQAEKFSVTKALKKLYTTFVNYGKKGYEAVKINANKVVDNVKITVHKLAKLCEYLLAKTNPQWNMPWGSKFDLDVLSSTMSPDGSVTEENKQYQVGYGYLRYRD